MATTLGHSLAGLIVYRLFNKTGRNPAESNNIRWPELIFVVILANLPDLDFIPGLVGGAVNRYHHGITHSLIFLAGLAALLALISGKIIRKNLGHRMLMIISAFFSHLLIDYFTMDFSWPFGLQIFWPLNDKFYLFPRAFLWPFWRDSLAGIFSLKNLATLAQESIFFGVILWLLRTKKGPDKSGPG